MRNADTRRQTLINMGRDIKDTLQELSIYTSSLEETGVIKPIKGHDSSTLRLLLNRAAEEAKSLDIQIQMIMDEECREVDNA